MSHTGPCPLPLLQLEVKLRSFMCSRYLWGLRHHVFVKLHQCKCVRTKTMVVLSQTHPHTPTLCKSSNRRTCTHYGRHINQSAHTFQWERERKNTYKLPSKHLNSMCPWIPLHLIQYLWAVAALVDVNVQTSKSEEFIWVNSNTHMQVPQVKY